HRQISRVTPVLGDGVGVEGCETRREYILVGSSPASMLATVSHPSTPTPHKLVLKNAKSPDGRAAGLFTGARQETGEVLTDRSGSNNTDESTVEFTFNFELHKAIGFGEQGVVFAQAHVHAWVKLGAALTHDDATGIDGLAAEHFNAETLGVGIATVAGTTACFLVSHFLHSS